MNGFVVTFFSLACVQAPAPSADPVRAGDSWQRLSDTLNVKTIDAFLHRALLDKYGASASEPLWSTGTPFTRRKFPVRLGRSEEWSPALSGTAYLLQDPLYTTLLGLMAEAHHSPVEHLGLIERVHLQGELWTFFDRLFLDGSHPYGRQAFAQDRWRTLLRECALLVKALAFNEAELRAIPSGDDLRRQIFGLNGIGKGTPTEFYSMQYLSLHDAAHQFRRVNRFFYWDPGRDFSSLSPNQIESLRNRALTFGEGAVAVLEEDAVVLSKTGQLVPTTVPLFFKAYRVLDPAGKESPLRFQMYQVDRTSEGLGGRALRPMPDDTEAWAQVELPNIAGYQENPAMRAPMAYVCGGCHAPLPNAFSPSLFAPITSLYRLTKEANTFSPERTVRIKFHAPEYELLKEYFDGLGSRPERASGPPVESEPRRLSSGVETAIALGVAVVAMGMVRLWKRPASARPGAGGPT